LGIGVNEISLLVSASESHSMKNLRQSRADQWTKVARMAAAAQGRFRLVGTISVAFGCPFEGAVDPATVVADAARFRDLGVEHVALGDTYQHQGAVRPPAPRGSRRRVDRASSRHPRHRPGQCARRP
jgi:isopropylmalate/homocitrate/citramalate synthase